MGNGIERVHEKVRFNLMPLIMRLERVLVELSVYTGDGVF